MSNWLIAVTTAIYTATACTQLWEGHRGLSIMFVGYAIANIGIILESYI